LSGDPRQEYFSDGLTEELTTALGKLSPEELGVIARTSVMRYKGTKKSISEIGRELGADYLIEGSVRRGRGRVRVAVQLIRTDDETHGGLGSTR
jgi:TolB-like protein